MRMMEAQAAMLRGDKVRRKCWSGPDLPDFIVLAPGRDITVDRKPLLDHLPLGTVMAVEPHVDAIFIAGDGKVRCILGADWLMANHPFADDWEICPAL